MIPVVTAMDTVTSDRQSPEYPAPGFEEKLFSKIQSFVEIETCFFSVNIYKFR